MSESVERQGCGCQPCTCGPTCRCAEANTETVCACDPSCACDSCTCEPATV